MPRKAKRTMSGDPASPPRPAVGVPYGEGERRLESQRRMPVPDFARSASAGATADGGGSRPPSAPADQFAQALELARAMPPPGSPLKAPTEHPEEHLMTGVGTAMPQLDPALYELRALAKVFDYPDLLRFLERVEREM